MPSSEISPKTGKIVVVGSANTDMVARVDKLPHPGETVLASAFETVAGGKGANQAVAAARLGADVTFICRVGADSFGDAAIDGFKSDGIDVSYIVRDTDVPTGVALIGVSSTGQNSIIVAPGANGRLSVDDIDAAADAIRAADVVVAQLEVPLAAVGRAFQLAREAGAVTILNPAPALSFPCSLMSLTSVLTPNETEAATLCGVDDEDLDPVRAGATLRALGVETVIITLGAAGALLSTVEAADTIAGTLVEQVVDTTAAGDSFTGALAVAIAEGRPLNDAVRFANAAASISVARAGAQPSMPRRREVDNRLVP
jgi:ribokinase